MEEENTIRDLNRQVNYYKKLNEYNVELVDKQNNIIKFLQTELTSLRDLVEKLSKVKP